MCYDKLAKQNTNCLECSEFYECNSKNMKIGLKTKFKLFSIEINKRISKLRIKLKVRIYVSFDILKFKILCFKYKMKSKYYEMRNRKIIKKFNL